ncbi:unnamed protein product [Thlaspi arvense]|uniref:GBF-interacting protein 1 N-terminal domain-containing protein n=1 Tax=Thlaspi arvense TaxID=13288 RepID=A0AAU9S4R3_THLAR|nr:unnamed protein product [Thlaspi arvense]
MVTGSRTADNRVMGLDDEDRKVIQSIKEVVGNHSDADIYIALKEANMNADEAVQKLIHQDPFHEVKRRKDRKKEDAVSVEPANKKKPIENVTTEAKVPTQPEHNVRRGGYSRNIFPRNAAPRNAFPRNPAVGSNKEFRVVRDNRSNPNVDEEMKHSSAQSSGSNISKLVATVDKKGSTGGLGNHRSSGAQDFGDDCNASAYVKRRHAEIAPLHRPTRKEFSAGKQTAHGATLPSTNSVLGVYLSSTDPVHVPSPVSRSSPVGAIRREVRGGGFGGKPSENAGKDPSATAGSLSGSSIRKSGTPNAYQSSAPASKIDQPSQTTTRESALPRGVEKNRPLLNRQRGNRGSQYARTQQQVGGHSKGVSQNKEWKPKSITKPVGHNDGVIETPTKSQACPADNSINLETESAKLQDKLSHIHFSESQHVIIADDIRVPEAARCQLTFGNFGEEFSLSRNSASAFQESCSSEELKESDRSPPVTSPEALTDGPGIKPIDIVGDDARISGSDSPVSVASEQQLPEQKEAHRSGNKDEYSGIQLLNRNGLPHTPLEFEQQQDAPELHKNSVRFLEIVPSKIARQINTLKTDTLVLFQQAYDNHGSYDFPYFSPAMDENVRGQGLPSQQEFLSPVYVPQMPMPGYSGNQAAYAHPSNGNSYVLMPGNGSHLGSNGVKYGIQQFKPVPTGGLTGFGNYNNPNGYQINSPNVVGNAMGLEDPSRMKYKDGSIYVPNPQAETSEIWMQNPRDLSSLQSPPYYNVAGQTHHGAYLSSHSHTQHPSFNAAAAQSSQMQFQGLFHPQQPGAMANPHHMGPGLGGNVGVGVVPSPPSQLATYQQSQLGHPNWPANF